MSKVLVFICNVDNILEEMQSICIMEVYPINIIFFKYCWDRAKWVEQWEGGRVIHIEELYNPSIFATWLCKPLIFYDFRIHSLKYLKSTTLGCKAIGIKNQSLWQRLNSFCLAWKWRHSGRKHLLWNLSFFVAWRVRMVSISVGLLRNFNILIDQHFLSHF